ncbi:MAG: DUF1571 domain-containing protein [Pirellulaceae bacterium]|nr:DUF1571 domain-containing protein [Pirellulaceae bacterium]
MRQFNLNFLLLLSTLGLSVGVYADDDNDGPVRVAKKLDVKVNKPHPLDAAIEMAQRGLRRVETIKDYKANLIRRERINGKLSGLEYSEVKIRNHQPEKNIPFSIYMRFTKPKSVNGREAIWIDGRNNGKIIAHEAGMILGKITVFLNPTGPIAMRGNRYPINEIGFRVLVERLIEKAEREKQYDECEVKVEPGRTFFKRPCTVIEVIHPQQRDHFDFYRANIYIDDELQLPVRYEAWTWPKEEGGKPELLEQYLYTNIELDVNLSDDDFNPRSKQYNYYFNDVAQVQKVETEENKKVQK